MKKSGLRGRGGAGFPTGLKWSFMPKEVDGPAALPRRQRRRVRARHLQGPRDHAPRSAQADRGLPDRRLRHGRARRLHLHPRRVLQRGARSCRRRSTRPTTPGLLGKNACGSGWDFDLYVHRGAGAYICGEETALLESLEGKKGMPRLKPPFPAGVGLYGCPTTVNNVEIDRGRADHPAPRRRLVRRLRPAEEHRHQALLHLGHVNKPCNVEEEMGIPLRELIERHCRRRARRLGQSAGGDPGRLLGAAAAQVDLRHGADGFRLRCASQKSGLGTAARHRHGQVDRRRQGDRAALPSSTSTRAAASARRAARAPAGCGG